ncbi:substrate-binding periplasmic protein [Pseudomonas tohonis]|uniref:substrate-binding periplasmic protein n=1 Tax=Pseudomonas tohonis TaxID=2725477 RepID=UPI001F161852|nr:transporter substrate-binding domain-containing protein [Pseudomonas tohonis]
MLARTLCLAALLCCALQASARPLKVDLYLPDAPPLTMLEAGNSHGIVGDATLLALKRAGYQVRILVAPWARAQKRTMEGRDILVIPLSRTPDREASYTWIAPIMELQRAFFSLDEPVKDFAEARARYRQIGVGLGTAQNEILRREGFDSGQIRSLVLGDKPAQLLEMGRIDAWFTGVPEALYIWPKVSHQRLRMSPPLAATDLYLACSLACDPQLVDDLRKAIDALRADGSLRRIQARYLKDAQPLLERQAP